MNKLIPALIVIICVLSVVLAIAIIDNHTLFRRNIQLGTRNQELTAELAVYRIDEARREENDKRTWGRQGKLDTLDLDRWILCEHNGLDIWLPVFYTDTVDTVRDTLEGSDE